MAPVPLRTWPTMVCRCAVHLFQRRQQFAGFVLRSDVDLAAQVARGHGLHELERHAVALADGLVLLAVFVAVGQGRRQRPHAALVVGLVLRVGVDLGFRGQLEAGAFGHLDHIGLVDVAARGLGILRHGFRQAVVGHAQHAARLQAGVQRLEQFLDLVVAQLDESCARCGR
jgi:hypothetical protein